MTNEEFYAKMREVHRDPGLTFEERPDGWFIVWGEVGLVEALVPRGDDRWAYYSDVGSDFDPKNPGVPFEQSDVGPWGDGPGCRPFSEMRKTYGSLTEGTFEEIIAVFEEIERQNDDFPVPPPTDPLYLIYAWRQEAEVPFYLLFGSADLDFDPDTTWEDEGSFPEGYEMVALETQTRRVLWLEEEWIPSEDLTADQIPSDPPLWVPPEPDDGLIEFELWEVPSPDSPEGGRFLKTYRGGWRIPEPDFWAEVSPGACPVVVRRDSGGVFRAAPRGSPRTLVGIAFEEAMSGDMGFEEANAETRRWFDSLKRPLN